MIIYASRTGNIRFICKRLDGISCVDIKEIEQATEPFFMFTYTDKIGHVPESVMQFLYKNKAHLKGVIASGNINFGNAFCLSADVISKEFNVPIIRKIDLRGTTKDVESIMKQYEELFTKEG